MGVSVSVWVWVARISVLNGGVKTAPDIPPLFIPNPRSAIQTNTKYVEKKHQLTETNVKS